MIAVRMTLTLERGQKTPKPTKTFSPSIPSQSWQTPSFSTFQSQDFTAIPKPFPSCLYLLKAWFPTCFSKCSPHHYAQYHHDVIKTSVFLGNSNGVPKCLNIALLTSTLAPATEAAKNCEAQPLSWQILDGTKRDLPQFDKSDASNRCRNFFSFFF